MHAKKSSLIKGLLACLLLLSFASFLHAADDARFTLNDGVIYDSKLGLQWAPAPNRSMNHYKAEEYARNLSLAGGGWRLPTRAELKSLYEPSKPGGADPKLNVSDFFVWTSELNGPSDAWFFDFNNGNEYRNGRDNSNNNDRVLAVRSRQ